MLTALVLLYLLVPPAGRAALARTRRIGVPVGLALALWAGLPGALLADLVSLRAEAEILVAYAPVGVLAAFGGELTERRLLGPRPKRVYGRGQGAGIALAVYLVAVGLVAVPLYLFVFWTGQPFGLEPGRLPLPAGARITSDSGPGSCAAHFCQRDLRVEGPPGLAGSIGERLAADGWQPAGQGRWTRRNGWLIDDRPAYVSLTPEGDVVLVELAGSDGFG